MDLMDSSQVTAAIIGIQQDLATIKNDLEWIKKNSTSENLAIKEVCTKIEEVESWQDRAEGAITLAKILGGMGAAGLFMNILERLFGV